MKIKALAGIMIMIIALSGCGKPAASIVSVSKEADISINTSSGSSAEIGSPTGTSAAENGSAAETSSGISDKDPAESPSSVINSAENGSESTSDTFLSDLIASMTLEEKVAQMTMPAFDYWDADVENCFKETCPGGVILFARNCKDPDSLLELNTTLQRNACENGHKIPIFIAIDQEGGVVTRITFERDYPEAAAIAESGPPSMAYDNAVIMGRELASYGFNVDFAPVMDVDSNPLNPIIGRRSFSSDPDVVSEYGVQMLKGLEATGIIGCLKHFPGHGDTSTDSHTGLPRVDKTLDELRELELIPFKAGIDAGAKMIMTAHIEFPNIEPSEYHPINSSDPSEKICLPATLSKTILTDVLRKELGYDGIIVTDALEMKAISSFFPLMEATSLSVNAGADIMLIPVRITGPAGISAYRQYIKDFADLVRAGEISESRIDESVMRILKLKYN